MIELHVCEDAPIALEVKEEIVYGGGGDPTGTKTINVTENGTKTENVAQYANAQIITNVPNSYSAGDEGKVVSDGALVSQTSATKTANGTYDTTLNNEIVVEVPGSSPSGTKQINVTENGTTTEDVAAYASAQIIANVPNTYSAGDEGKVVSNGALVSQGSDTVTTNDTYDTTLISSLTVNVSGGGGSGIDVSDLATSISYNTIGGLFKAMQEGTWDSLEMTNVLGTDPIEINFGRAIKGYICYPKAVTVLGGLSTNNNVAFSIALFGDPDGNGAQTVSWSVMKSKTGGTSETNLFPRCTAYSLVNGLLSLTPQYPSNNSYQPFMPGEAYIFAYWWEAS